MESAADESSLAATAAAFAPPHLVTLSPFPPPISPSPRRLSSHFTPAARPVRAARQLAWVSLQGRLVGAEEASSARAIGGGLSAEEAVAWELFSPMQRFLIVAVIAVAAANSKKNRQISQLMKSVEIRDQVLSGMQQKLDNLCEQVNYFKDQPDVSSYKSKFIGCGCRLCDQHQLPPILGHVDSAMKTNEDETIKYKLSLRNYAEPEERRMSDLSDWAPSVSSSVDTQWNSPAIEQDIYNLQRECEEKDATIKELSISLHSSEYVGSKRAAELEDVIRRKNMIITKLKKDLVILEQKVMHLTRLRRPSSSKSSSSERRLPAMTDNLIYDMDSTTSHSSSDSDCPTRKQLRYPVLSKDDTPAQSTASLVKDEAIPAQSSVFVLREKQHLGQSKGSNLAAKLTNRPPKSHAVSPLKEKSMNQLLDSVSQSKTKLSSSASGDLKSRRRGTTNSNIASSRKRWA